MNSEKISGESADQTFQSVTKLYESRVPVPKWLLAGLVVVTLVFTFGVVSELYSYYHASKILRVPGQSGHLNMAAVSFVLALCLVATLIYWLQPLHNIVHKEGVRLALGKRFVDLKFEDFDKVETARWWDAFRKFATGNPITKRGVMLTLKRKPPLGFWMQTLVGAGSRLVYLPDKDPEAFLKEINRAWDAWRPPHGGQTAPAPAADSHAA